MGKISLNVPLAPNASDVAQSGQHVFHHFLPISDTIFRSGIYVTAAGRRIARPGEDYLQVSHPPIYQFNWNEGRILPDFAFILINAGSGIFETRTTGQVAIGTGTAFLLFPGVWHRFRPVRETGWTISWMAFSGQLAHQLWNQKIISPEHAVISPANQRATRNALDRLLNHVHADPSSNSPLLSLQMLTVLTLALGDAPATSSPATRDRQKSPPDALVSAALTFIWTSSHRLISVEDVATSVGANRRTLERRMKFLVGRSVLDEIIRCRLNRAERLLRETDLPVKTVVSLAGFGSAENMRRIFLSKLGYSPADYRSHHARPRPS